MGVTSNVNECMSVLHVRTVYTHIKNLNKKYIHVVGAGTCWCYMLYEPDTICLSYMVCGHVYIGVISYANRCIFALHV